MSWECPECGETNDDDLILCFCGFVDELQDVEQITLSGSQERKLGRKHTEANADSEHSSFLGKYSYMCWVICFFIALWIYRGTMDGVLLILILCLLVAVRLRHCFKNGASFVPGLGEGESLWTYGLRRALANSLVYWLYPEGHVKSGDNVLGERHWGIILMGGMLLTMITVHCYMSIIIIVDLVSPDLTTHLLARINAPFVPLLEYWSGPQNNINDLITHGYGSRVAIVAHSFIATAIGSVFCFGSYIAYLLMHKGAVEAICSDARTKGSKRLANSGGKLGAVLARDPVLLYVFHLLVSVAMLYVIYIMSYRLHFPGERAPGSRQYAWLNSYVYRENLGLFTPILIVYFVCFFSACTILLFEPFYKSYQFIHRFFTRQP
jgi:hypothetical protein